MLLSGLCMLHCIAGIVLVAGLGLGGEVLLSPAFHRIGLALAIVIGAITLVMGVARHGDPRPLQAGGAGIAMMTVALFVGQMIQTDGGGLVESTLNTRRSDALDAPRLSVAMAVNG